MQSPWDANTIRHGAHMQQVRGGLRLKSGSVLNAIRLAINIADAAMDSG
jgi:hypothetical protein